jgi:hypothetical protein
MFYAFEILIDNFYAFEGILHSNYRQKWKKFEVKSAKKFIIRPHALFYVTIRIVHFSFPVHLIICELSLVSVAAGPSEHAVTRSNVILKSSLIIPSLHQPPHNISFHNWKSDHEIFMNNSFRIGYHWIMWRLQSLFCCYGVNNLQNKHMLCQDKHRCLI